MSECTGKLTIRQISRGSSQGWSRSGSLVGPEVRASDKFPDVVSQDLTLEAACNVSSIEQHLYWS
jgi:hypothetical protein